MMEQYRPRLSLRVAVQVVLFALVSPSLPVLVSCDWTWGEGWAFALVNAMGFFFSRLLVARRHPDLIAERSRMMNHSDIKNWDKVLAPLVAFGLIAVMVVAGVDHRLSGASPSIPPWARWAALMGIVGGYAFSAWALLENRFFSGVVRIQHDRGHHVVTSGPYRVVRHPGYAGGLLVYLLAPVVLASMAAVVPAVLATVALVVRTALEDRTLQGELSGYADYARQIRYRLLPGVW